MCVFVGVEIVMGSRNLQIEGKTYEKSQRKEERELTCIGATANKLLYEIQELKRSLYIRPR